MSTAAQCSILNLPFTCLSCTEIEPLTFRDNATALESGGSITFSRKGETRPNCSVFAFRMTSSSLVLCISGIGYGSNVSCLALVNSL